MAPFRYESSVDPRQSATIADIMLRRGDIAAQAARDNGAIWGGAVQNIGQMIGAIPAQLRQAKRAELQDQIGTQQLADMQANAAERVTQHTEQELARHQAQTSQLGLKLHDQLRPGDDQHNLAVMQEALNEGERLGLFSNEQAQQFGAAVSADPTRIPDVAKGWAGLTAAGRAEIEKTITNKPGDVTTSRWDGTTVGTPIPEKKPDYTINGQRFSGATGEPIGETVPPQHVPVPKSIESKNVLLDGKPAIVNFNPATGQHTLPDGTDVSSRVKPIPPASVQVTNSSGTKDDAESIADAIANGEQPPTTTGLFRLAGPVRAALAKRGFDLTKANLDFDATKKHLATLNGSKITTMRSSITTATDSLDVIDSLAKQWDAGRFPILNKANLTLAKNGAYGKDAAAIASQLEGQITDVVSELGQVYMGGNSPTDHALKLAEKNLSATWDKDVLLSMTKLARTNLKIRSNSIANSGAVLSGGPADAPSTPTHRFNPATGKVEPIS